MIWKLVFANAVHNKNGEVVLREKGSLEKLVEAVKSGADIRIGLREWENSGSGNRDKDVVYTRWNTESVRMLRDKSLVIATFTIHGSNVRPRESLGGSGGHAVEMTVAAGKGPFVCAVRSDGIETLYASDGTVVFESNRLDHPRQYEWFADLAPEPPPPPPPPPPRTEPRRRGGGV